MRWASAAQDSESKLLLYKPSTSNLFSYPCLDRYFTPSDVMSLMQKIISEIPPVLLVSSAPFTSDSISSSPMTT